MNIIYCIDEFPPVFWGGLGTYAREMTGRLSRRHVHPAVLSRSTGNLPLSDLWNGIPVYRPDVLKINNTIPYLVPSGVESWSFPDQRFFLETIQYNQLGAYHYIRTFHQAKNHPFQLVVSHDWASATAGLIIRENLDIPFIFHFHSHEQGRMENPSQIITDIERTAAEKADAIITVSHAMKDALVKLGFQKEKIQVVHNGVDPDSFSPDLFTVDSISEFRSQTGVHDSPMILYVGRLTSIKGVENLIRAMPEVAREIPNVKLVILGVGELENRLRFMTGELGLSDSIIFTCRHVAEKELKMHYAACDCAVFPSKYEAFGIVCTEAMAMAKPVVAGVLGTSGFYEQVTIHGDEQNGFHINPDSPEDIAKHLCILLKNPDMRKKFGLAGRKRIEKDFTWEVAADKTAAIYHQVHNPKQP